MEQKTLVKYIVSDKRVMFFLVVIIIANILIINQLYEKMFKPSYLDVANTFFVARDSVTLIRLNEQLLKLELLQKHINEVSFNEIQEALNDTVYLINNVNKEMEAKNKVWGGIKEKIEFDKDTYKVLKTNLSAISTVTNSQMDAIKDIVTDSYKPTIWDYILNYIVSFVLGILASLIATKLLKNNSKKSEKMF